MYAHLLICFELQLTLSVHQKIIKPKSQKFTYFLLFLKKLINKNLKCFVKLFTKSVTSYACALKIYSSQENPVEFSGEGSKGGGGVTLFFRFQRFSNFEMRYLDEFLCKWKILHGGDELGPKLCSGRFPAKSATKSARNFCYPKILRFFATRWPAPPPLIFRKIIWWKKILFFSRA